MSHLVWLFPRGFRATIVTMMGSARSAIWAAGVGGWLVGAWSGTPLMADAPPLQEAPTPALASEWGVGRWVPDLDIRPESGSRSSLSKLTRDARAVVIAVTSTSCPVSGRYGPTLAALEKEYASRGVRFVWINPVATDSKASVRQWIREQGAQGPYVRDERGDIAKALGIRSTAEVFVLDAARTVQFRGAVDDQYGLGYSKAAPNQRYLVSALESVLAGNGVETACTRVPGCALESAAPVAVSQPVTYHNRISRILQQSCVPCHREGGVAPFALTTPAEVAAHAGMVRKQVTQGVMPPWFAAPPTHGPSPWLNDRSLPAADKADLLAWMERGRPEGKAAHAPKVRTYPSEWQLGEPDAIVRLPEPVDVAASGVMTYVNIEVPTGFDSDRWVQGWEIRPSARDVVHHVLVYVLPPGKDGKPQKNRRIDGTSNYLAAYAPGYQAVSYPEGWAKFIPAGSTLHFQLHYTPKGKATRDQSALGLKFSKTPPKHEVRVSAIAGAIDIPPGDPDFKVEGQLPVPESARLMSFMPHMHVRGKAYRYELELPGSAPKTLLDVPRYDFNWQLLYRLSEHIDLPAGSVLKGTARYDNSAGNPANPDPTRRVQWGEQTDEEMMLGYIEYYLPEVPPGTPVDPRPTAGRRGRSKAFDALDRNHDGRITLDESPSPAQFKAADVDGNGEVTRDELKTFLQKSNTRAAAGSKPSSAAP